MMIYKSSSEFSSLNPCMQTLLSFMSKKSYWICLFVCFLTCRMTSLPFPCLRLPNASSAPTAIAYFSVSKLDSPTGVSGTGIASGRYGCHIDPSTTTMIQTGLTNSPVPDAFDYLGIGKDLFPLQTEMGIS